MKNPYEILEVPFNVSHNSLGDKWQFKTRSREQEEAFQLLRDRRYRKLWDSIEDYRVLARAGFFVEDYAEELMPFPGHREKLPKVSSGVILLMTGSFDPIHQGHLGAMEKAKEIVRDQGKNPVLSIFSPSHASYSDTKRSDPHTVQERFALVEEATRNDPSSICGTWEACSNRAAINFTKVVDHYQLRFKNCEVVFVFGEDNAEFALAFPDPETWLCISRDGHSQDSVPVYTHDYSHLSSTSVRLARVSA